MFMINLHIIDRKPFFISNLLALLVFSSGIISCNKEINTIALDITPIQINNEGLLSIDKEKAVLTGSIDRLNDEKVTDYGILIKDVENPYSQEQVISMGDNPKIGAFEYRYVPQSGFLLGERFQYQFYLRTEKGYYKSPTAYVTYSGLKVTSSPMQIATTGDTIQLMGDFNMLDSRYTVGIADLGVSRLPITLNSEKTQLSFVVPHTKGHHNRVVDISLSRYETTAFYTQNLTKIKLIGKVEAPTKTHYYFYDNITFSGIDRDFFNDGSLRLIINGKIIPYKSTVSIQSVLPITGNFKMGYINGRDSVIFPQEYSINRPQDDLLNLKTAILHPGQLLSLDFSELFTYFSPVIPEVTIDQHLVRFNGSNNLNFTYDTGKIPVGTYTINLSHPSGDFQLKNKLEVVDFDFTVPPVSKVLMGDKVEITGNFISGQQYVISTSSDNYSRQVEADGNKVTFEVSNLSAGLNSLKIGYKVSSSDYRYIDKIISLDVIPPTFESFYPSKAMPGTIITLKGKRIKYVNGIYVGGVAVQAIMATDDEIKFPLPSYIPKGKVRIGLWISGELITSTEYLEVY